MTTINTPQKRRMSSIINELEYGFQEFDDIANGKIRNGPAALPYQKRIKINDGSTQIINSQI